MNRSASEFSILYFISYPCYRYCNHLPESYDYYFSLFGFYNGYCCFYSVVILFNSRILIRVCSSSLIEYPIVLYMFSDENNKLETYTYVRTK